MIPLFKEFPKLQDKLSYISLGQFPTPTQKLETLSNWLGINLYIKRDDLSGVVYGGNKVRKLEFLLSDALRLKAREIITFGGAGSNHALATAIYSKKLGLQSTSILTLQPNAHYVRQNLLMSHHVGTKLHLCETTWHQRKRKYLISLVKTYYLLKYWVKDRKVPYVIPFGGSSPLGAIGFVNAAFELKNQIENDELVEPELIYVAAGSLGTTAGLILGCKAAGLKSRVISVLVIDEKNTKEHLLNLLIKTNSLLCALDPSFPNITFNEGDINIRKEFSGKQYALFTPDGIDAISLIREKESIQLEGTYTGKAFAAVIHDAKMDILKNKYVLFWNTNNSRDFPEIISRVDYRILPKGFHSFFIEKVQPLDR